MGSDLAIVMERSQPEALVSLASRLLAQAAFAGGAQILFRLGGSVWARPPAQWPAPGPEVEAWLRAQEFPDLATYWQMAVECTAPRLSICRSSRHAWAIPELPPGWRDDSLVGFLADAREAGREIAWLA